MTGILDAAGPIVAMIVMFSIPLVLILTNHQRKMALMMRDDVNRGQMPVQPDVEILRREVDVVKHQLNQQTILLDSIASQQRELMAKLDSAGTVEERLRNTAV